VDGRKPPLLLPSYLALWTQIRYTLYDNDGH
jgi:hypothetical protein